MWNRYRGAASPIDDLPHTISEAPHIPLPNYTGALRSILSPYSHSIIPGERVLY
jgi:hypothetical protein